MDIEKVPEIPKYIRYDFLITLLGAFLLGVWWYFSYVAKINDPDSGLSAFFIFGLLSLIWGFGEMYSNYREEKDLSQLQGVLEKKEIYTKLMDYRIINKTQNNFLITSLKENIKNMIKEKKEDKKPKKKRKGKRK